MLETFSAAPLAVKWRTVLVPGKKKEVMAMMERVINELKGLMRRFKRFV